jgi:endonuclease/exonuclease/phosphatase (EEP) superfamily protein YafD
MANAKMRRARRLINLPSGAYALGLTLFLVLRLLFGDSLWWLAFFGNFTPFYFAPLIVLLPLALVVRSRRAALLLLPFALIGVLWFGPLYLPRAAAEPTGAPTLRVVTFNVWRNNQNLGAVEKWLRAQNADVVITLEVAPEWSEHILALTDVYPAQSYADAQGYNWDSAVLSQHPILSSDQLDFGDGEMPQQRVVIDVAGQPVAIYGVHLHLPQGDTPHLRRLSRFAPSEFFRYDQTVRDAQISNLIDRLQHEPLPYIVAGDFNMSDQASVYNDLAAIMDDSFREAGRGLGTSWPVAQALGFPGLIPPLVRIDYIWHSSDFRTLEAAQGPYLGSDHLPLYATLALE